MPENGKAQEFIGVLGLFAALDKKIWKLLAKKNPQN
jgi:hypothetical protein